MFFPLFPIPDRDSVWNKRENCSNFSEIRKVTSDDTRQHFCIEWYWFLSGPSRSEITMFYFNIPFGSSAGELGHVGEEHEEAMLEYHSVVRKAALRHVFLLF